jgi:hypothetical protein
MSSLQKFHRRTQSVGPKTPPVLGSGNNTKGYYLGLAGDGTSFMYVAPISTEVSAQWGSFGTRRNTTSITDGLANTNTLVSFGTLSHPAAGVCKYLTTGGYNTWYLPAQNELTTMYNNRNTTPFATANAFLGEYYFSSTEYSGSYGHQSAMTRQFGSGSAYPNYKSSSFKVRAVRKE